MPIIYREEYGIRPRSDGLLGYELVVPTVQRFKEADLTDVRLDRVYIYGPEGMERSYLRDKMGARFMDNQPGTENDFAYLSTLPSRERK